MADGTRNYFSATAAHSATEIQESTDALPASWFSSQQMYEFERRAIFSKRWLFISHKSRLAQTGDWLRYSFAGYDIIITRDRQGAINSFHNVCRHRAYPVIEKEGAGNNKILACRYHGWSYGLNGKLAKAPGYQEMNLDKDQNSLFRCHTKIDNKGFIWINLDAKEIPGVSWEEKFDDVGAQSQVTQTNFDDYAFAQEVKKENGKYNWKHASADLRPEQMKYDSSTYYFPNASSTVSAKYIAIQKVFPQAPAKTTRHCELYRHKDCSDEEFRMISDAYARVLKEDKTTETTSNLFQTFVKDCITEHYRQEKAAGKEIWPSRPATFGDGNQIDEDEEICAGLACGSQKEVLAW
ncbi:hypothetical protein N0V94_006936 [Neodidymelliopsis sp. IMI 364377]|nr:hypothetical protein N0V94_006936 [Neodidymelliopsis sp. IMI 364377]